MKDISLVGGSNPPARAKSFNRGVGESLLENRPVKGLQFKAPPAPPIQPYNLDVQ